MLHAVAHQWAMAHRLRTAALESKTLTLYLMEVVAVAVKVIDFIRSRAFQLLA